MPEISQPDFRITALDPDLLTTPFKVQTNWHVITGAASCGKTTLIDLLADKGFQTVPEIPRQYIEVQLACGRVLEDIILTATTQRGMVEMQLNVERGLRASDFVFLDRGIPDNLWYCRLSGMDPNELLEACFHHRYASVFLLDRLPLHKDGMRFEDDATIGLGEACHVRDYSALGFDVVRVPVLSPQERLEFIFERLIEQGLL
jgi:predicted ATPase